MTLDTSKKENRTVDTNIKLFKRFLKDIGLYHIYIEERKQYISRIEVIHFSDDNIFNPVKTLKYLPQLINASFIWAKTSSPSLWATLNQLTYNMNLGGTFTADKMSWIKDEIKKYE